MKLDRLNEWLTLAEDVGVIAGSAAREYLDELAANADNVRPITELQPWLDERN